MPCAACESTGMILAAEYIPSLLRLMLGLTRESGIGSPGPESAPIPDFLPGIGEGIPIPDSAGNGNRGHDSPGRGFPGLGAPIPDSKFVRRTRPGGAGMWVPSPICQSPGDHWHWHSHPHCTPSPISSCQNRGSSCSTIEYCKGVLLKWYHFLAAGPQRVCPNRNWTTL
jgi:hypothetical protein